MLPATAADERLARQRAIAVGSLILLGAAAAMSPDTPLWLRAGPTSAALCLGWFAFVHPGPGSSVAVLAAAISVVCVTGVLWQIAMPAALGLLAVASWWEPRLRHERLPLGCVPSLATLGCAAVTPVALAGWVLLFTPDLHDITDAIPAVSALARLLGAAAFALLNACFEEWIWRGVIQSKLSALFPASAAIALQAASFGAAHAHGFPRGVAGIALAGTWGAMLGVLRLRAKGLLAPVAAHVVADATIAAIVLLWVRR